MSNPIGWGGESPEELAGKIKAHPFATAREALMQKIVLVAQKHSQERTPVRTGTLRRSETTRIESGGLQGFVGTNIVYAPFVHRRVPFFEQGIADSRAEIEKLLQQAGDAYLGELSG